MDDSIKKQDVKCDIMEKSQLLSGIPGNIEQIPI